MLSETLRSDALVQRLARQVAERSDGVPLFVLEIARNLEAKDTGEMTDIDVPSAVRDLVGARLQTLGDDERNMLDCASVQGFSFDPDLVARALETKPIQVLQRLAALERRSGIVRAHGSGYRFDHHQIQELLYTDQPPPLRANYHTLTADAFETRQKLAQVERPEGAAAYFMADHRLRGTDPLGAKRYLAGAFAHVDNDYRHDAFLDLCGRALETPDLLSPEERCDVLVRKGRVHGNLGQRAKQSACLDEAVAIADSLGAPARRCEARSHRGWYSFELGRYAEARAIFEEALGIADDDALRRKLSGRLASVLSTLGHQEEALRLEQPSANNRGLCHQYLGQYAQARACFDEAASAEGDPSARHVAQLNVGRMQAALGDAERARATIEAARTELKAMGLRRPESYAVHRLGELAEQVGRPDEAAALYEQALRLRRDIAYPSGVAESLLALGRLRRRLGKDADALLDEASRVAREIDRPDEIVLSEVWRGGGADAAEAALRSYGPRMRVRDRMEAHFELWKATKRPDHLDEARRLHRLLLEHAPADCRTAMLANVPIHAEIERA
jgi:tetratricopeptide (TPR) repeat protein